MWKILLFLALFPALILSLYTNKQASECFERKADSICSPIIKNCVDDEACQKELTQFQNCSFGGPDGIFNGYCFRKWGEQASLTGEMISCLIGECNLIYNSKVDIVGLHECTNQKMMENMN